MTEFHGELIYHHRDFVTAGGLISYGPNLADEWRKTGGIGSDMGATCRNFPI
jgi:hypothetical protein